MSSVSEKSFEELLSLTSEEEHLYSKMHLESPLPVVFHDAVILTGSSIEAVADPQDGSEQGTRELISDFDGQLD